ncbi:hypothetical protein [Schlesneria sp. T3-172]|uniref:hypothetical protein n=1 Tax=Schlesneria sphaerica TaxID=3373610 RepID=UPI0037CB1373
MSSLNFTAEMASFPTRPEHFVVYAVCTCVFLGSIWLLNSGQSTGSRLVLWGVLVTVLSCGYGLIGIPTMVLAIPGMQKLGVLLVLGGIAHSLISSVPAKPVKEVDHD